MSFEVVVTPGFAKDARKLAKRHRSITNDIERLITSLETKPAQGISLGKDCYKVRLRITSKGQGKSGGGRVITCVKVVAETIYLLSIFDKSEKESLTDKDLDQLLRFTGLIV